MLIVKEDQIVVAWVLFMHEVGLSLSCNNSNESGKMHLDKANTFLGEVPRASY